MLEEAMIGDPLSPTATTWDHKGVKLPVLIISVRVALDYGDRPFDA
jgi:hypothetical protein